jgi:Cu/Ag efflux pump CusA
MKKLTNFAVNYPVTILMVVLGVLLLGVISYQKLGIDLFPDLYPTSKPSQPVKAGCLMYPPSLKQVRPR